MQLSGMNHLMIDDLLNFVTGEIPKIWIEEDEMKKRKSDNLTIRIDDPIFTLFLLWII